MAREGYDDARPGHVPGAASSQRIAQACAAAAFLLSAAMLLVITLWPSILSRPLHDFLDPHTFICAMLLAVSLHLWYHLRYPTRRVGTMVMVLLAGVLLLLSSVSSIYFVIDLLFRYSGGTHSIKGAHALPAFLRLHPVPFLIMLPLSVGILLLPLEQRLGRRYGDWPVLLALVVAQAGFTKATLGPDGSNVHDCIDLLFVLSLLGAAVLFATPAQGLFSLQFRRGTGGIMMRRLMPVAFLLPTLLAVFRAYGERMEIYPPWVGSIVSVVLTTVFVSALVLFTASRLERIDERRRRAMRQLEEEQARFQSAFEYAAIGICLVDLQGRPIKVNHSLCTMLGYSESELLGRHFRDITHPDDIARDSAQVEELLRGAGHSYQMTKRYLHREGHVVWALLSVSLVRDVDHRPCYFISQVQDITQRELAQQSLRETYNELAQAKSLLEATFNSTTDFIAAVNRDLELIAFNQAFLREMAAIFDVEVQLRRSLPGLLTQYPADQANVTQLLLHVLAHGHIVKESTLGDAARVQRTYEIALGPIHDETGAVVGASFVARDVSDRRRLEQNLRQREEHFRTLLEFAPDAMLVVDTAGVVRRVNSRTEALFGYSRDALIGQDVSVLLPVSSRRAYPDMLAWALQQAGVQHLGEVQNVRGLRCDGTEFPIEVSICPITIEGERRIIAAIRDISERSRMLEALRKSEEHLQIALESARVGIWNWDPVLGKLTWDAHMGPLFGLPAGAQPRSYEESMHVIHPDDRMAYVQEAIASLESKEYFDERFRALHPDGTIRWLASHARVWRDATGRPIRLAGACWDVSDEKHQELARQRVSDELKRSNEDLQQFAYAASHDLQEPLRAVAGCAQILQHRYNDLLDDEGREIIRHTVDGAKRMQTLIEDLLAYSRVGTRDIRVELVPVDEPLREALLNLEMAIAETGAQFWLEALPRVKADRGQLRQLFQNLIANAMKFRDTAPPRIVVQADRGIHCWTFHITDNGIGIDPVHSSRVFQVFQRLHTRGAYPGTGIGLAICKRIVERHGGRIWFTSGEDTGTTFHFTLADDPQQDCP